MFELFVMTEIAPKHTQVIVHEDGRITNHCAETPLKELQFDFGDVVFMVRATGKGLPTKYWGIVYDGDEEVWKVGKMAFKRLHEAFEHALFLKDKRDYFLKKIERDINKKKIVV